MVSEFNKRLEEIENFLEDSVSLPLATNKYIVNGDKLKGMIDSLRTSLPGELKKARDIVEAREKLVAKAQEEANIVTERAKKNAEITLTKAKKASEDLLENARLRAEEMIDEQKITEAANERARETIEKAKQDAIKMREVTLKYIDQIVSESEKSLENSLNTLNALKQTYSSNNNNGENE